MTSCTKTSIVYNEPNKIFGLPLYYYRKRNCDTNLNSYTPANQYQKLKIIQNTVRVYSSLYTSNLGSLTAYSQPYINNKNNIGVCWNQMSDRPIPSVQNISIPTGYNTSLNKRHTSVTSSKPGSQTPGGIGCDIKHNSYDRYLNRLKGKGPLRRGIISSNFGVPLPFNPAFPIYGGKTTKTNIVNGCKTNIINSQCSTGTPYQNLLQDIQIYNNPLFYPDISGNCSYQIGDFVYAIEGNNTYYSKAIILSISQNLYTIQFENGNQQQETYDKLKIYFNNNYVNSLQDGLVAVNSILDSGFLQTCIANVTNL